LADLYEHFISQLLPINSNEDQENDGESLSIEDKLQKAQQLESLQNQLDKLKSKLKIEKQFNRKVELNKQIQVIESDLNKLMN
jgi:hypothetical protein